jgi:hypothetical protein
MTCIKGRTVKLLASRLGPHLLQILGSRPTVEGTLGEDVSWYPADSFHNPPGCLAWGILLSPTVNPTANDHEEFLS